VSARLGPEWRALVEVLGEFADATFTCDTDRAEESCTALSKACRALLAAEGREASRVISHGRVQLNRHPLLRECFDLMGLIEELPASTLATDCSTAAGNLLQHLADELGPAPASPAPAEPDPDLDAMLVRLRLDTIDKQLAETEFEVLEADRAQTETQRLIHAHVQRREAAAREAGIAEARKAFVDNYNEALASGCDNDGAYDCAIEAAFALTRSQP